VVAIGMVGSQAGHLLAYWLRFGDVSLQVQAAGAHAYFPAVAKTALGLAAVAALVSLLAIGAARMVGGRRVVPATSPSLLRVLAILFSLQLACFTVQETAEAALAGVHLGSAPALLLWGAAGQLPVAAVAALALRWLGARLAPAVAAIRSRFQPPSRRHELVFAQAAWPLAAETAVSSESIAFSLTRRGPPSSF
jgi:hypothetical protein